MGSVLQFLLFLSLNMVRGGMIKYKVSKNEGNRTFGRDQEERYAYSSMLALTGMPCLAVPV